MGCEWLPELIFFSAHRGHWPDYLDALHRKFTNDFVHSLPSWPGKRVAVKRHPEIDGKSATFWHLISEGAVEADRIPDMRRCERIGWPRPIMDAFDEQEPRVSSQLVWWKERRRSEDRYLLAPDDFSYLVVVADRGTYVLPWTAFVLEHEHQRRKRRQAFEAYWRLRKS